MATPAGLAAQIMFGEETSYGVYAAPTRSIDLVNETVKHNIARIISKGLRAGRLVTTSSQWSAGKRNSAGDLNLELANVSFGLLLKHMFGSISTSGGSGVFTHTATPGDLTGKSLSVQIGRPSVAGVVTPFTYLGTKVTNWELACKAGEIATLKVGLFAQNESIVRSVTDGATTTSQPTLTSATAAFTQNDVGIGVSGAGIPAATTILSVQSATSVTMSANATATASGVSVTFGGTLQSFAETAGYSPLTFVGATLSVAGSQVDVADVTIKGNNNLDVTRWRVRGASTAKEPLQNGLRDYGGTLTPDFQDLTLYNKYINANEVALVATFVGGLISGTSFYTHTITMNVRLDGDTPVVPGPQILTNPITFAAVANGGADSSAISWAFQTSDATP